MQVFVILMALPPSLLCCDDPGLPANTPLQYLIYLMAQMGAFQQFRARTHGFRLVATNSYSTVWCPLAPNIAIRARPTSQPGLPPRRRNPLVQEGHVASLLNSHYP